jgi:hypothetical protein
MELVETEIWSDISGFEGKYQVSNLGRVKSLSRKRVSKDRFLTLQVDDGYYKVGLYNFCKQRKRVFVHRLVALAFIPNPLNYSVVNHKDCNKQNNNVDNLEWVTTQENTKHAMENGRMANGERNGWFKGKIQCFDKEGKLIHEFVGQKQIIEAGFRYQHVYKCVLGKRKSHKDCTFKREST